MSTSRMLNLTETLGTIMLTVISGCTLFAIVAVMLGIAAVLIVFQTICDLAAAVLTKLTALIEWLAS